MSASSGSSNVWYESASLMKARQIGTLLTIRAARKVTRTVGARPSAALASVVLHSTGYCA